MFVAIDKHLQLRDFCYPFIGMEDHTASGSAHRLGFWGNGKFFWIDDSSWNISVQYDENTLVGSAIAKNDFLGISVHFEDFVYTTHNVFFRKLTIQNIAKGRQEIRIFFHHDFYIYGDKQKDTAQYEPELDSILCYRGKRYFLIGGGWEENASLTKGFDQYAIGKSKFLDKEGTYKDAEDGELQENPIEQGSVDSTIRFSETFSPNEKKSLFCWIAVGKRYKDVQHLHKRIGNMGPQKIMNHTRYFWKQWVQKESNNFNDLPKSITTFFKRSLLIMKTHTDRQGAIIAAADSDIMSTNRDNYNYMWPRDGALTAMAFSRAGYKNPSEHFFYFCQKILPEQGCFFHKYNPDGSLGSSWHPKVREGKKLFPIQEDESALVLVALQTYHECFSCIDTVQTFFNSLVLPIGKFLTQFVDPETGLPLPSYDLWEQDYAVSTYTTACTIAGIRSAAVLSHATGHYESAQYFEEQAEKMRGALLLHLFSQEHNRFIKHISFREKKEINASVDASIMFLFRLGVLPWNDKRMISTIEAIDSHLSVPGNIGGIARFEKDAYHFDFSSAHHNSYPGNPWIITTLWRAEYFIHQAKTKKELQKPMQMLEWVMNRANAAGILPEQVHPITGAPLSVAPLTWSHSAFVCAVLEFLKKSEEF
jgi:GH15 family glucan-1,4-alpha-glucosidase